MTLKAILPVLYRSNQYRPGDVLPADNREMVDAWLVAGSAVWQDEDAIPAAAPKAKRATASPGTTGISSDGDPEARVGRLPETPERKSGSRKK